VKKRPLSNSLVFQLGKIKKVGPPSTDSSVCFISLRAVTFPLLPVATLLLAKIDAAPPPLLLVEASSALPKPLFELNMSFPAFYVIYI
jgi:hypothetical protein